MVKNPQIMLYTDGACSVNPGRGGWACILDFKGTRKTLSGGLADTTNNRMELLAVIMGLEALTKPCEVTVVTDSRYVADSVTKGWLANWLKKVNFAGKKNEDLWIRLNKQLQRHKVEFQWVKGHKGHPENEECDRLAVLAYQPENELEQDIR